MKPDPAAKYAVQLALEGLNKQAKDLLDEANNICKGRKVRIVSDWNGMPWGRSRKPLTGQVFEVERVGLDPHWGAYVFVKGERCSIRAKEVEWL